MKVVPTCPRCGAPVRKPSAWSSAWQCGLHGEVDPLGAVHSPSRAGLDGLLRTEGVPVWLPWPLPKGWLVTGFAGAGLDGPDPGLGFATAQPHASVQVDHHDFPLWHVDAPGRAAFAGEVMGCWLWAVLWPDTAGVLFLEPLTLRDLRDPGQELDLPFGAPSPQLPGWPR